ncbi:tRNA pseudouridine(38-40) synthase TruA [Gayadomonas joobiniege]|uniref:tRNA pseudouridine(38-40) synthase TruA n=1 Tax=Gayadomonas joobiniege TaxID=1234606 RepID=UPI00037A047F|nr:tRNA pseudouridine(38-40) synthase TruA [Gayadomonas joobiniege]
MKIALGVEYEGANYSGWQRQSHVKSVQQTLEQALSQIAQSEISVVCAGRTDAGVHATGQVVHFECPVPRKLSAWTLGANTLLPDDIAIRWSHLVDRHFDARFSATARRYRYIIFNNRFRPGILRHGVTQIYEPLDATKMHQAAQALVGEQDFTAFRASHCQSNTPYRNVHKVSVVRMGAYLVVDISANAFLHHMVRNIVGSLVEVGKGVQPIDWLKTLLMQKDRTLAAATAKANGLYLVDVTYPDKFELPKVPVGPLFLPDQDLFER